MVDKLQHVKTKGEMLPGKGESRNPVNSMERLVKAELMGRENIWKDMQGVKLLVCPPYPSRGEELELFFFFFFSRKY